MKLLEIILYEHIRHMTSRLLHCTAALLNIVLPSCIQLTDLFAATALPRAFLHRRHAHSAPNRQPRVGHWPSANPPVGQCGSWLDWLATLMGMLDECWNDFRTSSSAISTSPMTVAREALNNLMALIWSEIYLWSPSCHRWYFVVNDIAPACITMD